MPESPLDFEVVVVGGGPAGIAAACVAVENGRRTALIDETPWLGGQIWRGQDVKARVPEATRWIERLRNSKVTLLGQCTVLGVASERKILTEQPSGPREIQWERLILATGARELFLPFPGWTLPGNFGPGGLQSLAKHGWPVAGKRVVIAGSGPLLLAVARGLHMMGAQIVSINEQAPLARLISFGTELMRRPSKLAQAARLKISLLGTPHRCGVWPLKADGDGRVQSVVLTDGHRKWTENCDYFACGFGLVPNIELPLAVGCQLQNGFTKVDEWQCSSVPNVFCAGELTGIGGADAALVEGQIAGLAASECHEAARWLFSHRARWQRFAFALADTFALRNEVVTLASPETIVCRCEDIRFDRLMDFSSWRDAKLQTRCGMGSCQGRICGAAAKVLFGWGMESVRPPILPARVNSFRHGTR